MSVTFNNTVYQTGFVGEDDGAASSGFSLDNTSTNSITINGTVSKVGDSVVATGLLPGGSDTGNMATTNTLYVTQYDNTGMIEFSNTNPPTGNSFRFVLSNSVLASNKRVTFTDESTTGPTLYTVCFVKGTLIRTVSGDVAVEKLKIGDLAITASGAQRPIRWIGTRSYIGRFANRNDDVLPICLKAGSLSDRVPQRDLWVSPKHAMFLDGLLVPAECLVNGVTVIRATHVERVDYFHVELDSHDVLLANGAPSESFVDDNGRQIFQNSHEFAALYPDAAHTETVYCAPRLESGPELEAIRSRIDARARGIRKTA